MNFTVQPMRGVPVMNADGLQDGALLRQPEEPPQASRLKCAAVLTFLPAAFVIEKALANVLALSVAPVAGVTANWNVTGPMISEPGGTASVSASGLAMPLLGLPNRHALKRPKGCTKFGFGSACRSESNVSVQPGCVAPAADWPVRAIALTAPTGTLK